MKKAKPRKKTQGFAFAVGRRYQLRNGETITLTCMAPALALDRTAREPCMQGKFSDGCLTAFKPDGTYRPAFPGKPHELDIVKEVK